MKYTKKLLSLVLVLVLALALAVPGFAAGETYSITINDATAGKTYEAYQVFAGTWSDTAENLVDITWGNGVKGTDLLNALKADDTIGSYFTAAETAEDVAYVLSNTANEFGNDSAKMQKFADVVGSCLTTTTYTTNQQSESKYVISGVPGGYYLVQNKAVGDGQAFTRFILEVVKNTEAAPKDTSVATLEKKVWNEDLAKGGAWSDTADAGFTDTVKFQLTATLPADLNVYDVYKVIFHDKLAAAFTFDTYEVYLNSVDEGNKITDSFVAVTENANDMTFTCADITAIDGKTVSGGNTIILEYTATVNNTANVGNAGNINEGWLEFSNNNNEATGASTTTTAHDKVVVYTYQMDAIKIDGQNQDPLPGAQFMLKNSEGKYVKLDDDKKVQNWVDKGQATTINTGVDGKIAIIGLDAGTYTLEEIKAPDGYNLMDEGEAKVVISASLAGTWTSGNAADGITGLNVSVTVDGQPSNGTGTVADGKVTFNVVNNKGTTLPSTGGMGTTIFYTLGGVLVVGAAILLVTKKRVHDVEG